MNLAGNSTLTKLSTSGVECVESVVGCFCKALVEQIQNIALQESTSSAKKDGGRKTVTNEWLKSEGIGALRDPVLRVLLFLQPLSHADASSSASRAASQPASAVKGSGVGGSGGGGGDDLQTAAGVAMCCNLL